MIAGLPLESWVLIVLSVGIGLAVEVRFFLVHRRHPPGARRDTSGAGGAPPP